MRQIGTLLTEPQAQRFAAYLITQGITAHAEADGDEFIVWVRDENQLDQAKDELQQFKLDPDDRRYRGAEKQAGSLLMEEEKKRQQARKNVISMQGRWGHGAGRKTPLVFVLIAVSVFATLWTSYGKSPRMQQWGFCDAIHRVNPSWNEKSLSDSLIDIKNGQVWRLVSPIFVHLDIMHLVFNMYWAYIFGTMIEHRRGTLRFALIVLACAILPNIAQAWVSGPWFAGMSGVGYGLFGYVWMKTLYDPAAGIHVRRGTIIMFIIWFFVCMTGWIGPIANTAHGAGLVVGVVIGYAPVLWRQMSGR